MAKALPTLSKSPKAAAAEATESWLLLRHPLALDPRPRPSSSMKTLCYRWNSVIDSVPAMGWRRHLRAHLSLPFRVLGLGPVGASAGVSPCRCAAVFCVSDCQLLLREGSPDASPWSQAFRSDYTDHIHTRWTLYIHLTSIFHSYSFYGPLFPFLIFLLSLSPLFPFLLITLLLFSHFLLLSTHRIRWHKLEQKRLKSLSP